MKKTVLIVSFLFLLTVCSVSAQGGANVPNNSDPDINSKGVSGLFEIFTRKPNEEPTSSSGSGLWNSLLEKPTEIPIPTATPEPIPTATPEPIPTATPEPTPVPDPFADVTVQKGVVWRTYYCGSDFAFTIIYQPIMTTVQSQLRAKGTFILFRVQIQNLSDREIRGLKFESFTLSKTVNGAEIVYPLSAYFSNVTNMLWELGLLRNQIPPKGTLDTYLVFDVEGAANDPWVLNFLPMERFSTELQFTPIRVSLPAISAQ